MWIPVRKFYLEDGDLKNRLLYKHANIHVFSYIRARWAKVIGVMFSQLYVILKRREGKEGREEGMMLLNTCSSNESPVFVMFFAPSYPQCVTCIHKILQETSLVVWWFRRHLPVQGLWVQSLVG